MNQEFNLSGWRLVQKSIRKNRFHDVTLLIEGMGGRFALMAKHGYPPGVFRSPSGGVNPGEDIAAGGLREAHEETGLNIELKRLIAHITLDIIYKRDVITWDSYIFHATTADIHLKPTDHREVKANIWATPMQMDIIIEKLRETRVGGLIYRADLTELSLWALKNKLVIKQAKKFDLLYVLKTLKKNKMETKDFEKNRWWIAEVNTVHAAIMGLTARKDCVELIGPAVDTPYQGRGVGQALIDYVCDQWRDEQERQRLLSLKHLTKNEPLWLMTSNPGYYLNVDFEIVDREEAPQSLRRKMRGPHENDDPMRHRIYRSVF
jgi:N-acetylglutamate synthase-like GNAT family acetyltransferase/ADP-ribose pyrophosphatase YjhB (NUDIX family)